MVARESRRDLLQALARLEPPAVFDEAALRQFVYDRQQLLEVLRACDSSRDAETAVLIREAVTKTQPALTMIAKARAETARQLNSLHASRGRLLERNISDAPVSLLCEQA